MTGPSPLFVLLLLSWKLEVVGGETQRNPGVVIVVCLFVSILVLGLVMVAVKCFRKNINGFEKMDELPMETVREEAPFARLTPQ
ncbi:putative LOC729966 homolog isoform X2 [Sminthopsis crassicaudata]|uniref:putative LOC729966 homolog isoform X2 n=1 Tax=Sminthopsis crassicaudata TaxID=9301 RepID=UPI003D68B334